MLYYSSGGADKELLKEDLRRGLYKALDTLGQRQKVLVLPPDFTRFHSRAGDITYMVWEYYKNKLTDILPAIGTHFPMTKDEIKEIWKTILKAQHHDISWIEVTDLRGKSIDRLKKAIERKIIPSKK